MSVLIGHNRSDSISTLAIEKVKVSLTKHLRGTLFEFNFKSTLYLKNY